MSIDKSRFVKQISQLNWKWHLIGGDRPIALHTKYNKWDQSFCRCSFGQSLQGHNKSWYVFRIDDSARNSFTPLWTDHFANRSQPNYQIVHHLFHSQFKHQNRSGKLIQSLHTKPVWNVLPSGRVWPAHLVWWTWFCCFSWFGKEEFAQNHFFVFFFNFE